MPKDPYYQNRLKKSRKETKRRKKVRRLSEEIQTTTRLLIITIGILLFASTVSFLYISSLKAAKGYYLQQLQQEYEDLSSDNRELSSDLQDIQAITQIEDSDSIDNMAEPEDLNISYVSEPSDLASR
ncbi:hypothetical protein HN748_00180 [Candidatus Peregrinibacteria bacterium]|jgi:hypothetical protein|nr:hypothetical protein [Candidatus Peregrinibacteria bacterium]MBT7483600.1 hypothetical protein [Candidatus Peregrinibacteria bacterium]MBT7702629.1 hypothetical protein [Candidatus Peregrinibacteria bacterium]